MPIDVTPRILYIILGRSADVWMQFAGPRDLRGTTATGKSGWLYSTLEEKREDRVKGKKDVPIVSLRGDNRGSFT